MGCKVEKKFASLAKITQPSFSGVFQRQRLFKQLDSSRKYPITWITGPPGSGKTVLVSTYLQASTLPCLWYQIDEGDSDIATFFYYMGMAAKKASPRKKKPLPLLTPEYMLGIPTFTKRYFEDLYSRLHIPFVVVLDNYQKVSETSLLHDVIRNGLSVIPEGINVIIISRSEPPPALAYKRLDSSMDMIGWDDLRFTLEEVAELVYMRKAKMPERVINQLHFKTDGWIAGLVLILKSVEKEEIEPQLLSEFTPREIFDYFASEIFERTENDLQEFLLRTAFLPRMTPLMAEELTGQKHSRHILSGLNRDNYFTEKHLVSEPAYQYHPLFREFLLTRAKDTFLPSDLKETERKAATLLEAAGQVEHAITLLRDTGELYDIVQLILKHAPSLLAQGRNQILAEWINYIPDEILNKTPYLLYWLGASLIYINTDKSLEHFKKAFSLFKTQKDAAGIFMTWSGIIYSITYGFQKFKQLDPWISIANELLTEYKTFPSREIEARFATSMLIALSFRQPQHPDFENWSERALSLSRESADISLKSDTLSTLALHQLFSGDLSKAAHTIDSFHAVIQSGNASPYLQIFFKDIEAFFYWLGAKWEKCYSAAMDGLELSSATGVHLMDSFLSGHGAAGALGAEDTATAKRFFERMNLCLEKGSAWEQSFYHCVLAWEALLKGDLPKADLHSELMMKFNDESGYVPTTAIGYLLRAIVMHALGKEKKAEGLISEAHTIGCSIKSHLIEFMCLLSEAQFAFDRGDEASGRDLLRNAMAIGSKQGFVNTVLWHPLQMTQLCIKAMETGIEVEYVRNLIHKRKLIPDKPPLEIENWPWPLKIYTLGRFELVKEGKPLRFSGKIQQKPLSILKVLIALGGREVAAERLADTLWPEADGDAARSVFTTTLSRLRHLLGFEEAVIIHEGKATLNLQYCWVDVWVFERLLTQAESAHSKGQKEKAIESMQKAITLYTGHFLRGEEHPWAISLRERLRSKFITLIERLGYYYQEAEQWEEAIKCYIKGLEVDDLTERFYQNLMLCYQKLNRKAEAITVYKRCKKILPAFLGLDPSPETKAIYRALKST